LRLFAVEWRPVVEYRVPRRGEPSNNGRSILPHHGQDYVETTYLAPKAPVVCYPDSMPSTEIPDSHKDLLDADFATLATIGKDGGPQLTEVWFLHDDGQVKLSLNSSRLKTRNLLARSACSLLILDIQNPYRYVDLRGRARVQPDPDYAFADRVGAKYSSDLREHDAPGEERVVVTIEPTNVFAVDMSSG
jgi:hypothetical protein